MNLETVERLVKVQTELSNSLQNLVHTNKEYGTYTPTTELVKLLEQTAVSIQKELGVTNV